MTVANTTDELAVVGEGKVDVIPDTASIDVGITINNLSTAEEAKTQIDIINNRLVAVLKKLGLSSKDIKTTNYSINPNYTYENNKNTLSGYDGNATVTVKTQNTQLIPSIIEEATKAGANQINNTQFTVNEPEKYRESARENAIKNAKDQAEKLAKSLGIRLGRVTNIVESLGSTPISIQPLYDKMSSGMGGGAPTLESGSQTITSVVTLYFEKR